MVRGIRKISSVLVMMVMVLTLFTTKVEANEGSISQYDIDAIVQQFVEAYSDALLQKDVDELQQVLLENDSNTFFLAFMEWRLAIINYMDCEYSDHTCDVIGIDVKSNNGNTADIHIIFDEKFKYAKDGWEGFAYNIQADLKIIDTSEGCKVTQIGFTNEEDFYESFCTKISALEEQSKTRSGEDISLSDKLTVLISELEVQKEEMDSVTVNQVSNVSDDNDISALSSSFNYVGYRGAQYAIEYGKNPNPYFYQAASDCTNFVSQCVWAAYGGWSYGMSNSAMVSNISNKVRMVPNVWQGGSGGGMPNWESVVNFWNYTTSNQGKELCKNKFTNLYILGANNIIPISQYTATL